MQSSLMLRSRGLQFVFDCIRPMLPASARRLSAAADATPRRNNQKPKAGYRPLASSQHPDPSTPSTPKAASTPEAATTPVADSTPKVDNAPNAGSTSKQHSQDRLRPERLLDVAKEAAEAGAKVVREALTKRAAMGFTKSSYKNRVPQALAIEAITSSRKEILKVLTAHFPNHPVVTERQEKSGAGPPGADTDPEGDVSLGYVWCVDSLNGIVNFEHLYPFFAVSVGAMVGPEPVAGCVIEFSGGQGCWFDMTYAAYKGGGVTLDGQPIKPSSTDKINNALMGTQNDTDVILPNQASVKLFQHLTHITQGVRQLGSPAVSLCHVAKGTLDGYWAYMDKPWSTCAASLMVTEAGGKVTTMLGTPYSPFHRSILASNGKLQQALLDNNAQKVSSKLSKAGAQLYPTFIPLGYNAAFASQEVLEASLKAAAKAQPKAAKAPSSRAARDFEDSEMSERSTRTGTDTAEAWLTEPDSGEGQGQGQGQGQGSMDTFLPEFTVLSDKADKKVSKAPAEYTDVDDRRKRQSSQAAPPARRERKKLFDNPE